MMATATITPAVTGRKTCIGHADRIGVWECSRCHGVFCQECVKVREINRQSYEICKTCGDICRDIRVREADDARKRSFFEMVPAAFQYPVQGAGISFLVIGVIFFGVMDILSHSIFGKVFGVIGTGYFLAWLFKIVNDAAEGKKEFSGWPDVSDFYSDIVDPIRCVFITTLVSFGPAILFIILGFFIHPLLFLPALPLLLVGALYYPMAFLATALQTRLALNPAAIISAVMKVVPEYAVICGIFVLAGGILAVGGLVLTVAIPILGAVLAYALSLYLSIVEMRILGLLYYTSKERLGWFA
jgi:hypothetical protein